MKGRILGSLFALPFAAVGVFMLWSVGSTLSQAWQMQGWLPVSAHLLEAGYKTNTDDSNTYQVYATYRYAVASPSSSMSTPLHRIRPSFIAMFAGASSVLK
jgi:hypothetical protein